LFIALAGSGCLGLVGGRGSEPADASSEREDSGFGADASTSTADGGATARDGGGNTPRDAGRRPDAGYFDRDAGWGTGTDVGLFANGTWTPGRDSNGNINADSWASTPIGEWFVVADTRLDSLDAVVKAALPGWQDFGNERWDGVLADWNGLTIDQAGNRVWVVLGGGHAGSSNNGIYEFNAYRMRWRVERFPSDTTVWSESYRRAGTYSVCNESLEEMTGRQDAGVWSPINDVWWDELYWDRQPTSRHTYSAHAFAPDTNELILSARGLRLWRYSLTTREWTYRRVLEDGKRNYDGAGTYAFYDEVTGEYLHGGNADGVYNSIGYDTRRNEWVGWGSPWSIWGVADTRVDRQITAMTTINQDSYYEGKYWVYDLDTRSVKTSGTVQMGAGLSRAMFAKSDWYYDGASLCYVPPLNIYWFWQLMSDRQMHLFTVDPSTTPWTISEATMTGAVPQPHANLMRKMVWLPKMGAVLLVDQASRNVSLFRP